MPFKFSYRFLDDEVTVSKLMIEDWEIGALYWKMLAKYDGHDRETKACEDIKKKYWGDFALTKDLYLFLEQFMRAMQKTIQIHLLLSEHFHPTFSKLVKKELLLKLF